MGLDVYVGSLTRYYRNDWETVVQRIARQKGLEAEVVRFDSNSESEPLDVAAVHSHILFWRSELARLLEGRITGPIEWDESPDAPYLTDKPAWDTYVDLLLFAAYDEHRELDRPIEHIDDIENDPAMKRSTDPEFPTMYPHLLSFTEWWLPFDMDFVFRAADPAGTPAVFGSSIALERELRLLNARTFRGGKSDVEFWLENGTKHGAPMADGARFALALFLRLARRASRHRLVMKLDY